MSDKMEWLKEQLRTASQQVESHSEQLREAFMTEAREKMLSKADEEEE
jgi:hypothetical protein